MRKKNLKTIYFLCALLAFVGGAVGIAYCNLKASGSLYLLSDDGDIYLSITRNMLENVHFIQTVRAVKGFVVPPGLPAINTIVIFLTGRLSEFLVSNGLAGHAIGQANPDMLGLLGFQYMIYGLAASFMALTGLKMAFNGLDVAKKGAFIWQKEEGSETVASTGSPAVATVLPWVLSVMIGLTTPAFYVWCSTKIGHPNPGYILTENYTVFFIALIIWLVVKGTDVRKIVSVTFILTLFRPACCPLLIVAFAWMLIRAIYDRVAKNKPPFHERVRFYDIFVMLVVFALVIGINIGVNYLETGEIIPLEDYSSLDVFLANNDKAGPEWYSKDKISEFANTRYNQIVLNDNLTCYQQNRLAREALITYVDANTKTVINNACKRFIRLFCDTWGVVFYIFIICLVVQILLKGLNWARKVYILLAAAFLSLVPAFGLLVVRFSAPMIPLFVAVTIGTVGQLITIFITRPKKEAVQVQENVPEETISVEATEPQPVL